MASEDHDERVLVWAPAGRDAGLAVRVLGKAGFSALAIEDASALCDALEVGAGCVLLTEEVLAKDVAARLGAALARQPAWSDLPIVVFCDKTSTRARRDRSATLGNVTYLDRPVRVHSLVAAVRAALRTRARQYSARTAIRRRDEFLAMLGHELRNPLAAIVFAAELMERETLGDAASRSRGVIARQARHLTRLVDDLLDVARVTTGKIALRPEPVDLATIAERCVQQVEVLAAAKRQSLDISRDVVAVEIDGDPVRLEQVVVNLLTNAIKYTPPGGHVDVAVAREGGDAVLRVRDDGIGIDSTMATEVFELFAQAPSALDRSEGGLGLGLTVVRTIVELHGGTVRVDSQGLGHGAEFVVRLPLRRGPVRVLAAPPVVRESVALSIVLVDDNDDMREMLAEFLVAAGHTVQSAADGVGGLAAILAIRPDVAIVDIGLPGIDGYEIARRVRAQIGQAVRLVAVTGYGRAEDRERTRAAGFDGHLVKPAGVDEVLAAIDSLRTRTIAAG